MATNLYSNNRLKDNTITGASVASSVGIYDETVNYIAGSVVLWKHKEYKCSVAITGGDKGDLSNAPGLSSSWYKVDRYISVASDYDATQPWIFRTMEIKIISDIDITMPSSGFQAGETFFFQTLSGNGGNATLNPNGYTIDGDLNNIVLPSNSYLEIEKTTGNDWKIIRSKNISKEFAPSDLADLEFWLDANDSSSFTLSGNTITACTEKANSYATVSISGTPQLQSSQVNGKAAIFFDGANDNLNFGDRELHNNGAGRGLHIYAIAKPNATNDVIIGKYTTAGNMREWFFRTGYTRIYENGDQSGNEASTNTDMIIGDWSCGELRWGAGNKSQYYLNGGYREQSSLAVNDIEDTGADMIVGTYNGTANDMNGWIAEICVFSRPLTKTEQAQMNEYFTNKYALSIWSPTFIPKSFSVSSSLGGTVSVDTMLNVAGGVASNDAPFIVPFNCNLKAIMATTVGAETWSARVYRNGATLRTMAINNVDNYRRTYTTAVTAGDKISFGAVIGSSGDLESPAISIILEERV